MTSFGLNISPDLELESLILNKAISSMNSAVSDILVETLKKCYETNVYNLVGVELSDLERVLNEKYFSVKESMNANLTNICLINDEKVVSNINMLFEKACISMNTNMGSEYYKIAVKAAELIQNSVFELARQTLIKEIQDIGSLNPIKLKALVASQIKGYQELLEKGHSCWTLNETILSALSSEEDAFLLEIERIAHEQNKSSASKKRKNNDMPTPLDSINNPNSLNYLKSSNPENISSASSTKNPMITTFSSTSSSSSSPSPSTQLQRERALLFREQLAKDKEAASAKIVPKSTVNKK